MLSVSNVRVDKMRVRGPESGMYFNCPTAGNSDFATLSLELNKPNLPARRIDEDTGNDAPFAFNLEPGEQGWIELHLTGDPGSSYSGEVLADVSSGGRTESVRLPLSTGREFNLVDPGKHGRLLVEPGQSSGYFTCSIYPSDATRESSHSVTPETEDCTLSRIRSILGELEAGGPSTVDRDPEPTTEVPVNACIVGVWKTVAAEYRDSNIFDVLPGQATFRMISGIRGYVFKPDGTSYFYSDAVFEGVVEDGPKRGIIARRISNDVRVVMTYSAAQGRLDQVVSKVESGSIDHYFDGVFSGTKELQFGSLAPDAGSYTCQGDAMQVTGAAGDSARYMRMSG